MLTAITAQSMFPLTGEASSNALLNEGYVLT